MGEPQKNGKTKSPAFQLYADKAIAGTAHLSERGFKAYWMMLWWMWLNSKDQSSMPDTKTAWQAATLCKGKKLQLVKAELLAEGHPMLLKRGKRLVSNGLRKEAKKQTAYREQKVQAARARWDTEGEPSQRPARRKKVAGTSVDFMTDHPRFADLQGDPNLAQITQEEYMIVLQHHPKADEAKAVKETVSKALLMTTGIDNPALFLKAQFSRIESKSTGGNSRRSGLRDKKKKDDEAPF